MVLSLSALFWGLLSSLSLPAGALLGLATRPSQRVTSSLMAFGGGALLFALTIELFGHSLHVAETENQTLRAVATVLGALAGGLLFEGLNRILNAKGGFLRKHSLVVGEIEKTKVHQADQMLRSLSEIQFLQALPPEEFARLVPSLDTRRYQPGEVIFRQGDPGLELCFVVSGQAAVFRETEGRVTDIATLGPGDTFGEMALVSDQPRTATVRAATPLQVLTLGKADFVALLARSPAMQEASRHLVMERLHHIHQKDESFRAGAIEWHARALDQFSRFPVVVTQHDLDHAGHEAGGGAALAIWLGIALDGIPESLIIGMLVSAALATGSPMSLAFIAGVFLANLPEAMSSAVTMRRQGKKTWFILAMWLSLCLMTGLGAVAGASLFPAHPEGGLALLVAAIEGLAAGAMLTMIANTMLPEAFEQGGGTIAGLSTLAGFLAAVGVKLLE